MNRHERRWWASVLLFAAVFGAAQEQINQKEECTDPEVYNVLSAAITIRYVNNPDIKTLTIFQRTRPLRRGTGFPQNIADWRTFVKPEHGRVWLMLAKEYDRVNRRPLVLLPNLSLSKKYEFTSEEGVGEDSDYPGQIYVSAIAFNRARTLALVSIENESYCGGICGAHTTLLLEKKVEKWQEVDWPGDAIEIRE